jgi:hypothetical protein
MSNFKLNLPTDVPWERICVTEDMIDKVVCDKRLPAKWQTSMAVFKYRPDAEYQLYPQYTITYLKVTATITGYQPLDKEIQGNINWNGVDVSTIPGLTDLLNSYNPCHGAILQVVVGPEGQRADLPLKDYPFFMDFEPKKRELYELATDTKEKQSRSIESLNITKSSGNTQSMEILDIDQGGGGFGAQASYAGTGGGFTYTAPNGQWGTKRINADESLSSRSSDVGQEKRETFSYSTQLSQMYHLLDSYHLGTNRVVFFIQPRPHTLEEPSGFVRGPRPVEGIQEFFLIVAQPKDQHDFCVSLRLDTSHLTKTPIMDYDRKSETTPLVSATAPVASSHDIPAEHKVLDRACFGACWDVWYQCYRTEKTDSFTYNAPTGYTIEGFNDIINESNHGSSNVVVTPNGAALNIDVHANGHICYHDSGVCVDCDDEKEKFAGSARRQVQVNLVSTSPTKKVGEEEVLMITTRGLCCCASMFNRFHLDEYVVDFRSVPSALSVQKYLANTRTAETTYMNTARSTPLNSLAHQENSCKECAGHEPNAKMPVDNGHTIRLANELGSYIRIEALKSLNDPMVQLKKFIDTDFFAKQMEYKLIQFTKGRETLNTSVMQEVPKEAVANLEKYFGKKINVITRRNFLSLRAEELAKISGLSLEQVQKIKLEALGVKMHPHAYSANKDTDKKRHEDDDDMREDDGKKGSKSK